MKRRNQKTENIIPEHTQLVQKPVHFLVFFTLLSYVLSI